jgi:hypothetical protein
MLDCSLLLVVYFFLQVHHSYSLIVFSQFLYIKKLKIKINKDDNKIIVKIIQSFLKTTLKIVFYKSFIKVL